MHLPPLASLFFHILFMNIMLKISDLPLMTLDDILGRAHVGECPLDPGGYFVVKVR